MRMENFDIFLIIDFVEFLIFVLIIKAVFLILISYSHNVYFLSSL